MEAPNILSADVPDIIFDDRNKDYGTCGVKKNYQRRLRKVWFIMFLPAISMLAIYMLSALIKSAATSPLAICGISFDSVTETKNKISPIFSPSADSSKPRVVLMGIAIPVIVRDSDAVVSIHDDADTSNAKSGRVCKPAPDDTIKAKSGTVLTTSVSDASGRQNDYDIITDKVETECQYPGGSSEWINFLYHNLQYPENAVDKSIEGTVIVQFIVDKEGTVNTVTAVSGPEALREAATAVVKKSPQWIPATQNGRIVKSYKKQPITFRLSDGEKTVKDQVCDTLLSYF